VVELYEQGTLAEGKGKVTVDLLGLTSLDHLLLIMRTSFTYTVYLNEEVNGTALSPSVSVPCCMYYWQLKLFYSLLLTYLGYILHLGPML